MSGSRWLWQRDGKKGANPGEHVLLKPRREDSSQDPAPTAQGAPLWDRGCTGELPDLYVSVKLKKAHEFTAASPLS